MWMNSQISPPVWSWRKGGIVSYVSVMRLNFTLDAASASTVNQLRLALWLDAGAVNRRGRQQARLSAVSSTFYAFLFSHLFIF